MFFRKILIISTTLQGNQSVNKVDWENLVGKVGVSNFVAVYLLVRFEVILRENTTAIRDVHRFMKALWGTEDTDSPRR